MQSHPYFPAVIRDLPIFACRNRLTHSMSVPDQHNPKLPRADHPWERLPTTTDCQYFRLLIPTSSPSKLKVLSLGWSP